MTAENTRADAQLAHRSRLERLVLSISTEFIRLGVQTIDAAIERALGKIGSFCAVDRAYVFSLCGQKMSNTHEWCAAGVEPQRDNLQELPVETFPWFVQRLLHEEVVHVPLVSAMPEEAAAERAILEAQDIVSIVIVPLLFEGTVTGFIGFDSIRDGKVWADDDIVLLRIAGEIVVSALERKRADAHRRALEEQLIMARSLDNVARLAGGVAHDFNNLLSVILHHAVALEREVADPTLKDYARVLHESAAQAAELTRQLMIVGRRGIVASETLDSSLVLASLGKLLERTLGESIEFTLAPAQPLYVEIGKAQLKQIIVNLALNARDALPAGGRVRIDNELVDGPADDVLLAGRHWVRLRISDTGVGMTEEVRRRAFEPFFSTKGVLGTGLGLATVHAIVQHAGGHLRIDSEVGRGTVVDVYLPEAAPGARVDATPEPEPPPERGRGETILLVEDSTPLRTLVERLLVEHGYAVHAASAPAEALAIAARFPGVFDLLLTDVVLPGLSGRMLGEQLEASRRVRQVAYTSGYDDEALVRQGVVDPGILLLPKPFVERDLLVFVRRALERAGSPAR